MRLARLSLPALFASSLLLAASACTSDEATGGSIATPDGGSQIASTIAFTVNPPGVELDIGTTGTITLSSTTPLPAPASLSVAGLPPGVSVTFEPAVITTSATVTIAVANDATAGSYPVTLYGQVGGATGSVPVTLTIKAPAVGFALALNPGSASVAAGSHVPVALTLARKGGFDGDVTVSLVDPPSGVSAAAVTIPKGSNGAVLDLAVASGTNASDYTLTVRAAFGEAHQDVPFALGVTPEAGTLDPTFAQAGTSIPTLPAGFPEISEVSFAARAADGSFVYAAYRSAQNQTLLFKVKADGSFDPNFGPNVPDTTPVKKTGFMTVGYGYAEDFAIAANGKIVVALNYSSAIYRVLADGSALDPTFNGTGVVSVPGGIASLALDGDKVVVAGDPVGVAAKQEADIQAADPTLPLRRYTSAGALDTTFGGGVVQVAPPDYAIDPRVVVAGGVVYLGFSMYREETCFDFALTKLNAQNAVDTTFGTTGFSAVDFAKCDDFVRDILPQADGKIVLTGSARTPNGITGYGVARLAANGSIDPTFGNAGRTIVGTFGDERMHSALQADGKIVLTGTGYLEDLGPLSLVAFRLLPNGATDLGFGGDGRSFVAPPATLLATRGLRAYPNVDGRLVIAGAFEKSSGKDSTVGGPFLARFFQ